MDSRNVVDGHAVERGEPSTNEEIVRAIQHGVDGQDVVITTSLRETRRPRRRYRSILWAGAITKEKRIRGSIGRVEDAVVTDTDSAKVTGV
jgi:hypothetical protein